MNNNEWDNVVTKHNERGEYMERVVALYHSELESLEKLAASLQITISNEYENELHSNNSKYRVDLINSLVESQRLTHMMIIEAKKTLRQIDGMK